MSAKRKKPGGDKLAESAATSRLVRCSCGEVYDSLARPRCPNCNSEPPAKTDAAEAGAPPETAALQQSSLQVETPEWVWKAAASALALLLFVVVVKDIRACNQPSGGKAAAAAVRPASQPESSPGRSEAHPVEPVREPAVDPRIVGKWSSRTKTSSGSGDISLQLSADGAYSMAIASGANLWTHSGRFRTEGGRYYMNEVAPEGAARQVFSDYGSYEVIGSDSFRTEGSLKFTYQRVQPPADQPPERRAPGAAPARRWMPKKLWGGVRR